MLRSSRVSIKALTPVLLSAAVVMPLVAQPMNVDTEANSPLWWTLTDKLSPEELRAIYQDPSGSLRRYQDALDADLAPPLTKDQARALHFYYNPTLTPELVPLWQAFHVMASHHVGPTAVTVPHVELSRTGVSQKGIETILRMAEDHKRRVTHLIETVRDEQLEFVTIQRQVLTLRGADERATRELDRALADEDVGFLGRVTGQSPEQLQKLLIAWKTNAPAEAAVTSLSLLKKDLTPSDWDAFRRYLLETVVVGMGPFVDFK